MARQAGPFVFNGTVGDATGYKMNGQYYLKTKSLISRRRIKEHPQFSNTRRNAKWFGEAVKLARQVYHELDRCDRDQRTVWYPMRNRAQELVREGRPAEEIVCLLRKEFAEVGQTSKVKRQTKVQDKSNVSVANEIVLGRMMNPDVELQLTDQLAAAVAFVNTILDSKAATKERLYVKAGRLRLRR